MRKLIILLALFCFRSASADVGEPAIIPLSTCWVTGSFKPEEIMREQGSKGEPDRIYYDLAQEQIQRVLIVAFGRYGEKTLEKEELRCTPQSRHFEIRDDRGNEATLAATIRQFIDQKNLFSCPRQFDCWKSE